HFGAGGGTRTRTTFYGPRILSPVRLPFRHTGESLAPISDCNCGDESRWHRVAPMPSGPNCGQASRPKWLATPTLIAGQFIRRSKDRPTRNPSASWGPHGRNADAGRFEQAEGDAGMAMAYAGSQTT